MIKWNDQMRVKLYYSYLTGIEGNAKQRKNSSEYITSITTIINEHIKKNAVNFAMHEVRPTIAPRSVRTMNAEPISINRWHCLVIFFISFKYKSLSLLKIVSIYFAIIG